MVESERRALPRGIGMLGSSLLILLCIEGMLLGPMLLVLLATLIMAALHRA